MTDVKIDVKKHVFVGVITYNSTPGNAKFKVYNTDDGKYEQTNGDEVTAINKPSGVNILVDDLKTKWENIWASGDSGKFQENLQNFYEAANNAIADEKSPLNDTQKTLLNQIRIFMHPHDKKYVGNLPQYIGPDLKLRDTKSTESKLIQPSARRPKGASFELAGGSNDITAMAIAFKNMLDIESNYNNLVVPTLRGGANLDEDTALAYLRNKGLRLNSDNLQLIKSMLKSLQTNGLRGDVIDQINKSFSQVAKIEGILDALKQIPAAELKNITSMDVLVDKIHKKQDKATKSVENIVQVIIKGITS